MRVGDIRQGSQAAAGFAGGAAAATPTESRALIALTPAVQSAKVSAGCRQAPSQVAFDVPFLVHLLAVRDQHAQTRERRRAAPHEALSAYRATVRLVR